MPCLHILRHIAQKLLEKRKDGRWEARYVKSIDTDGRKNYGSVYGGSYHELRDKQLYLMQNTHFPSKQAHITLSELMREWLTGVSLPLKNLLAKNTKHGIRYRTLQHLHTFLQNSGNRYGQRWQKLPHWRYTYPYPCSSCCSWYCYFKKEEVTPFAQVSSAKKTAVFELRFYRQILQFKMNNDGISANTIRHYHSDIHKALTYAVKADLMLEIR